MELKVMISAYLILGNFKSQPQRERNGVAKGNAMEICAHDKPQQRRNKNFAEETRFHDLA